MKKTAIQIFNSLILCAVVCFASLTALAQNVADSDLSNTAGTNKNFREQWWLFGVIALVVLVLLWGYFRRRGRRV